MTTQDRDKVAILEEYYSRQAKGESGIARTMAARLGVTRARFYQILKEAHIGKHDFGAYREAEKVKKRVLWEKKYKAKWARLPHDRKAGTVRKIESLVCEMIFDGFNTTDIESLTGKHRTTIAHHANKCEIE